MFQSEIQTVPGYYDVHENTQGEKIIVLRGLSSEDQIAVPILQQTIHTHYGAILGWYWVLFVATIIYVAVTKVIFPLMKKNVFE